MFFNGFACRGFALCYYIFVDVDVTYVIPVTVIIFDAALDDIIYRTSCFRCRFDIAVLFFVIVFIGVDAMEQGRSIVRPNKILPLHASISKP